MSLVKPIVSVDNLRALQKEAMAFYVMYAKSELELGFGEKLQEVDFSAIACYFMYIKHDNPWSRERTLGALTGYMMFLFLISVYHPHYHLVPDLDTDHFWHTHIFLKTDKYHQDCQKLFGYYLHHQSHLTVGETQEYDSQGDFANTLLLLKKHFGTEALAKLAHTNAQKAATSGPMTTIINVSNCSPITSRH
ncbi:hypothetical protein [Nodularia chucula]|uniref:hypothetical protein n=1 Tax=Nodularia chucula TaxID=3093667 RepID=UPI0039C69D8F